MKSKSHPSPSPQKNNDSSPDSPVSSEEQESIDSSRCHIEDAKTKFGTFFFGLLLMLMGAGLLYFGFRPEAPYADHNKGNRDNKILLTCGFISTMLGLFCFVISILMFRNVPWLYENPIQLDEDPSA